MTEIESPTLLRRQLGRFLREAREGRGLTIAVAAKEVQLSFNGLQRLETGRAVKPRRQDVRELCMLYEVNPEHTEQAVGLASRAATARDEDGITPLGGLFSDAFNMYVGMERSARRLTSYEVQVPGLLQTADYARALIGAFLHDGSADEIEQRVRVRLNRQVAVTRKTRPVDLHVLLDEAALYRMVGGPKVMAEQHRYLADVSTRPNVTLRIHPWSAGYTRGILHGSFVLLDFGTDSKGSPIEPPVVYLDGGMSSDLYLERPEIVQRYTEMASAIRQTALDEKTTRDLLRRVARSYDSDR
ncbi:helix-turn-helix domain-containing protein [Nocardia abscessus]|uniref:helix-turn-helix domain-containing protein n=1 Tax=Nocardia abscessus TaxID=120957 RepID=UPI00030EFE1C|nr:helix-turn-helix transcriptional regulator [Nocardia abscessus]MCC3326988.1 helix-turn-helix domain-containing protein [Nocardia abscessus]